MKFKYIFTLITFMFTVFIINLSTQAKLMQFSDYEWLTEDSDNSSTGLYSSVNAEIDQHGLLRLLISENKNNSKLYGVKLTATNKTDYGLYRWEIISDPTLLDNRSRLFFILKEATSTSTTPKSNNTDDKLNAIVLLRFQRRVEVWFSATTSNGHKFVSRSNISDSDNLLTIEILYLPNFLRFRVIPTCIDGSKITDSYLVNAEAVYQKRMKSTEAVITYKSYCSEKEILEYQINGAVPFSNGNNVVTIALRKGLRKVNNIALNQTDVEIIIKSFSYQKVIA